MESIESDLRKFLAARKLKYTPERREVFGEIVQSEGRFDADELLQRLQSEQKQVSRATVYRALDLFVKLGVLRRVCLRDNTSLFENIMNWKNEGYLVCMQCGKSDSFVVDENIDSQLKKLASMADFRAQNRSIEVFGYCGDCR